MSKAIAPNSEYWKFRDIDQGFFNILQKKELWFSRPEFFNDPFDCQSNIEEIYESIGNTIKVFEEQCADMFKYIWGSEKNKNYAYLCLCQQWKPTLMWSHYAKNHGGVALGFSFGKQSPFMLEHTRSGAITYGTNIPRAILEIEQAYKKMRAYPLSYPGLTFDEKYSFIDDFEMCTKRLYHLARFSKAECWKYESEFRFEIDLKDQNKTGELRNYNAEDLKEIIFGINCHSDNIETVRKLLSGSEWGHVKYWRCKSDSVRLSLNAIEI